MKERLTELQSGMPIVFGGDKVVTVSPELADAFIQGDRLIVVQSTGDLLHIPAKEWANSTVAVDAALSAFAAMDETSDEQISAFYEMFASRLENDVIFESISQANAADVDRARELGRTTTRLFLTAEMRTGMIEGLRMWAKSETARGDVVETVVNEGWKLEQVNSGLGVVGFVFEGRPNVLADATGVLRSGNTVVFRIGSDALGTARAIVDHAVSPALSESGLPSGAVSLVDTPSRAAGWAMFSDPRLSLAVARGSGSAVSQLGVVARQAGIPVSLHGMGGAWIVASETADAEEFGLAVYHSLDRKVCNTLNTVCVVGSRAKDLFPVFLEALDRAGKRRGTKSKLHLTEEHVHLIPSAWFEMVKISRAHGSVIEPRTEIIPNDDLGVEWEWEESPEVTLTVVEDVDEAIDLFNEQSPRLVASLIAADPSEHQRFFNRIEAPFVGNGFTRWVDGQYALDRPELGLSNWQHGRLFGRGGILSGDSVFTLRSRAIQDDPDIGRM